MAHFARLNDQNKVTQVVVVNNDVATDEAAGVAFLKNIYGQNTIWKQTSYNTQRGVHALGGTPFRKNFAGIDMNYDESRHLCMGSPCTLQRPRSFTPGNLLG